MTMASSPPRSISARPGVDVAGGPDRAPPPRGPCGGRARRSSPSPRRQHDLDAEPGEEPDRRGVDAGIEHRLGAAGQDRHAPAPLAPAARTRPAARRRGTEGTRGRRQRQHRGERLQRRHARNSPAKGRPSAGKAERGAEAGRIGQARRRAERGSGGRAAAAIGLLDMRARVVDQVHVVDARGAGGHAGEAGQAAVDVQHRFAVGRAARSPACP